MPNIVDFSKFNEIKEKEINPFNWINPLVIEYALLPSVNGMIYAWRVKGTKHTFTIPLKRMNYLSEGDYGKHFIIALENFREDYVSWKDYKEEPEWVKEYKADYKNFIL